MNALQACHRAHWAWIKTQPQLVIPGVLDEPQQRSALLGFVEPAGLAAPHRRLPPGGLASHNNAPDRNTSPVQRGRGQKGA